ncbi:MAG: 50S ribosomal protein L10 [Thermodesulfovibrionales bacterium]|nr:50S ribosomal protein L10 [Thermodesulfovibrionales bacterium]
MGAQVPSLGKEDRLNRQQKAQQTLDLKEKFLKAKAVVLTTYSGLTVAEIAELRKHIGKEFHYKVIKNTLAKRASEDTPVSVAGDYFKGPVGVAIGYDDPVAVVKKVIEFSKKNEKLKLGAGVIEGRLFQADELRQIAELPPRRALLGILAGAMNAPLSKLASGLMQTVGRFANALHALKEKKAAA